ncbi:FDLD family class I lanthipeptide [Actinomycetota bacterium Odt1-20B]
MSPVALEAAEATEAVEGIEGIEGIEDVFDLDVEIELSSAEPDAAFPTIGCTGSCQTVINPLTCVSC